MFLRMLILEILISSFVKFSVFIIKDAVEIDDLICYLIDKDESEGAVLLGHSTGCQVVRTRIVFAASFLSVHCLSNFLTKSIHISGIDIGCCALHACKC